MVPETPATGAVDLSAARIPPGLGWKVNRGDRDDDDDGDDDYDDDIPQIDLKLA